MAVGLRGTPYVYIMYLLHRLALLLPGLLLACTGPSATDHTVREPITDSLSVVNADTVPFNVDYLCGRFDPARHPDFALIRPEHASKSDMYMRRDAYEAFCAMYEAALRDGVRLRIVSAARNYARQKAIWEAKWEGRALVEGGTNLKETVPDPVERARRILRFSSMPGTSRHHWGTDIDLNDLENDWFEKGEGLRIYTWLRTHAADYGYCQPYTAKGPERPHGYEEEKWHWSWMPVSRPLTRLAEERLRDEDLQGFLGDHTAETIGVVRHFVLGIAPECR